MVPEGYKEATEMATNTQKKPAATPTEAKKEAAAVTPAATVEAAPKFVLGTLPNVRAGTHRSYVQAILRHLNEKGPFTLPEMRKALNENPLDEKHPEKSTAKPKFGYEKHNFPTWCVKQGWIVKAEAKAETKAA
jgi:hypothetical protein